MTWETDKRPFGACLQAWRAANGWTRAELAHELRSPPTTVLGWLTGRPCVCEGALRRLMDAIDDQPGAMGSRRSS